MCRHSRLKSVFIAPAVDAAGAHPQGNHTSKAVDAFTRPGIRSCCRTRAAARAWGWCLVASTLSGVMLALSFPRVGLEGLAWVGLVPLFLHMRRMPFRSGFIAGLVYFGVLLWWLNIALTRYGGLPYVVAVPLYLLLTAYLATYVGGVTWAACRLERVLGLSTVITLPVLWIALESTRSTVLTGFPWALLGTSQQGRLSLLQSADIFGPFGLGFLLVLGNAVAARAAAVLRPAERNALPWRGFAVFVVLFAANWAYGAWRLGQVHRQAEGVRIGVVQGNIDQSLKWAPGMQRHTVGIYRDLSLRAANEGALNLVVWPETAAPFRFGEESSLTEAVRATARQSGASLLLGAPRRETDGGRARHFNSAFLLSPQGDTLGTSDKVHLVPFGEYVPLGRFFPFLSKMVAGAGDFSPGASRRLPFRDARLGVLICFEGIFPGLARDNARRGSGLLVNLTNDAWFGDSSASAQLLAMVRFRAVENHTWLVRAANNGISAIIDPRGRIVSRTPLFWRGVLRGRVEFGSHPTMYQRWGDVLPVCLAFLSVSWLLGTSSLVRARFRLTGRDL